MLRTPLFLSLLGLIWSCGASEPRSTSGTNAGTWSGGSAGVSPQGGGSGTAPTVAGASALAGNLSSGSASPSGVSAGGSDAGGALNQAGATVTGGAGAGGATNAGGAGGAGGAVTAGAAGAGGSSNTNGCPMDLVGWATVNANGVNGTTGGGNVASVKVTNFAELKAAAQDSAPRVIVVSGTIKTTDGGGSAMDVASNKTIVGADKNATIYGGLNLKGVNNIIIRNLNIHGVWPNSGPDDTLASRQSHHVWYDHLNIWDAGDGELDITNQSSYQTVSWTKFSYTNADHPHRLCSLNGSGGGDHPEDSGYLKVTYHHNWFGKLVKERMPRVMYGQVHVFNDYYTAADNLYCIGVGSFGAALIENNYFKDVRSPHIFMYDLHAHITARGNTYDNTTGNKDTGLGGTGGPSGVNADVPDAQAFTDPPYDYTLDATKDVPSIVSRCAGPQ